MREKMAADSGGRGDNDFKLKVWCGFVVEKTLS